MPANHGAPVGCSGEADIETIGRLVVNVRGASALGLHCAFTNLAPEATAAVDSALEKLDARYSVLVERATRVANSVAASLEEAISRGELGLHDLFSTDYRPIPGTDPAQYDHPALGVCQRRLMQVLQAVRAEDDRMMFCLAVDRNGYLPVHNAEYSQSQRPNDPAWNVAHCRNKRIFDDRAGLGAARNMRPYLIQSYARDMGMGRTVMTMEVDTPLRFRGRHWGAIRTAYAM